MLSVPGGVRVTHPAAQTSKRASVKAEDAATAGFSDACTTSRKFTFFWKMYFFMQEGVVKGAPLHQGDGMNTPGPVRNAAHHERFSSCARGISHALQQSRCIHGHAISLGCWLHAQRMLRKEIESPKTGGLHRCGGPPHSRRRHSDGTHGSGPAILSAHTASRPLRCACCSAAPHQRWPCVSAVCGLF